jgi:peptidoglycan/LPS O-acetylase OafA/YrhL
MESRIYFRNLGALRFFAAIAVIFHHVEQYKYWAGLPNLWGSTVIDALGTKAVSFFFVLSGFLISYLLMEENQKTGTISVKDFYIRRILRIWPVYYIVVILCLFVIPNVLDTSFLGIETYDSKFTWKALLLLFIVPNVLRVYAPNIVGGNQLWSIGVEEQFYIVWPVLFRSFIRNLVRFLLVFIAIKFVITVILDVLVNTQGGLVLSAISRFWVLLKIEQMAIGALGAWAIHAQKRGITTFMYHRSTWYMSLFGLASLFVLPFHHWTMSYTEAVVFLLVIVNLSTNPSIKISMEHPLLTRLGNISYGIYMYHTLCVTLCIYALKNFGMLDSSPVIFNLMMYMGSIILTLIVAFLSYELIEKKFLNLKERFMIVKSGRREN